MSSAPSKTGAGTSEDSKSPVSLRPQQRGLPLASGALRPQRKDGQSQSTPSDGPDGKQTQNSIPSEEKHPLSHIWSILYTSPNQTKGSFTDDSKTIKNVDTIEDFWCVLNNIPPPSKLAHRTNYHIFRQGVRPVWEDPFNKGGGQWILECQRQDVEIINKYWIMTAVTVIREAFGPDSEFVCGAEVTVRNKKSKINLWTRVATNRGAQLRIGNIWREALALPQSVKVSYQFFDDALSHSHSGYKYTLPGTV